MKKVLIFFMSVFALGFITVKSFAANNNYPVINQGMGSNLLDPEYLSIEDNCLEYKAWIEIDKNYDYVLFFNNMEWEESNCFVYIEFDDGSITSFQKENQLEPIFYLQFRKDKNLSTNKYFRICGLEHEYFRTVSLDRIKNSTTLFYAGGEEYYKPYFYNNSYVKNDKYTLVTTPEYKIDLNYVISNMKVVDDCGYQNFNIISDDGYNDNYMKPGNYNVSIESTNGKQKYTTSFTVLVFEMDIPLIEGPDKIAYSITDCYPDVSTGLEWISKIYKISYGSRSVELDYVIEDEENNNYLFGDVVNRPGVYKLTIKGIYKGNAVVTKEVELKIDNDLDPEIYYPNFMINLSNTINATNEQLENYLNQLLEIQGLFVDNVSVISNAYRGNERIEGIYEIIYEYEIDGKAYISKASINVTKNKKSDIEITNDNAIVENKDNKLIEYISMGVMATIIILMCTYFFIEKYKNRKKSI